MSPATMGTLLAVRAWQLTGRARGGLRSYRRRPRTRRRGRLLIAAAAVVAVQLAGAAAAMAADGAVTNPWLDAFGIKDSTGIATGAYNLSLGGAGGMSMSALSDGVARLLALLGWYLYVLLVTLGLWIFDWALQMKILAILDPVAAIIHDVLGSVIGRIGVVGVLLALAWASTVHYIGRGKTAAALMSFIVSLLMAAFVASPAIDLPHVMVGPTGAVSSARDFGLRVVADITSAGAPAAPAASVAAVGPAAAPAGESAADPAAPDAASADSDAVRAATSAKLATALIRKAHQMINYGSVIDGTKCEEAYNGILKTDAGSDEARSTMGECNKKYATAADSPMFALFGTVFVIPGGVLVATICLVFAGVLSVLVGMALWESAMFLLEVLKGILPGESRTGMLMKLGIIGAALFFIVLVLIGVGVFVLVIDAVLGQSTNAILAFVLIDLILIVVLVVLVAALISARRSGRRVGARIGKALSPEPHAGVSGGRAAPMQQAAGLVGQHVSTRRALRKELGGGARVGTPGPAGQEPASRLARVGGAVAGTVKATGTVAKVGLASTIGAPVYAPRAYGAAKKAMAAKKVAFAARIEKAKAAAAHKRDDAVAFGAEYAHNVGVGAKFAATVTGTSKAAEVVADKSRPAMVAGAIALGGRGAGAHGASTRAGAAGEGSRGARASVHAPGRISSRELPARAGASSSGSRASSQASSRTSSPASSSTSASRGSRAGVRTSPAAAGSGSPTHVEVGRTVSATEARAAASEAYRQQILARARLRRLDRNLSRRPAPMRIGSGT